MGTHQTRELQEWTRPTLRAQLGRRGRTTLGLASILLTAVLMTTACASGSGDEPGSSGPRPVVGTGVGPGISVAEALSPHLEGPLLVRGWLWRARGGELRLCTGLTGSVPPQCTQPGLTVRGLDLSNAEGLRNEDGVTWSLQPVLVLGTVKGGFLEISVLSQG